jgi:hypothetical protein
MSQYFNVKGLKVRISDHEPNFAMDKFRGSNDIELYTKSLEGKPLSIKNQILRVLETPLAIKKQLTIEDFNEVLGVKKRINVLQNEFEIIDNWFNNEQANQGLINDLRRNLNLFIPYKLNKLQKEKWVAYVQNKLNTKSISGTKNTKGPFFI